MLKATSKLLLLSIVGALIVISLWKIPERQRTYWEQHVRDNNLETLKPKEMFDIENQARTTLAQILGGVAFLIGLYFTRRTLILNREGQITDRFTSAIEQLGSDKLSVRLGGIYALERIARDSEKDFWQVMEVLTAYVRQNAPWKGEASEAPPRLASDIQAVLTTIGRRQRYLDAMANDPRLDLSGTDLRRAYWYKANLNGVRFNDAHLERASFHTVTLTWASFMNATLDGAVLLYTRMTGASLHGCSLNGVRCVDTNIENAAGITKEQLEQVAHDDPADFERVSEKRWSFKTRINS